MGWGNTKGAAGSFMLADVDPSLYIEYLADIVDAGVLVSLGRSRDGGALSVAFIHNGRKGREWYNNDEAFSAGIKELAVFLGVVSEPKPATTEGQTSRGGGKGS